MIYIPAAITPGPGPTAQLSLQHTPSATMAQWPQSHSQISSPGLCHLPSTTPGPSRCLTGRIHPSSSLACSLCPTDVQFPSGHPEGHAQPL